MNGVVVDEIARDSSEFWKIIHIPEKPPVLPHHQATVDVLVSVIDPKHTNTIVRKLNHIAPLEGLRHVKRVKKACLDGGKNQLSVVLCMASRNDGESNCMPEDVLELVNTYQLSTFTAKVCKYAASTKEEWAEQCKLWPTSFHPPTYNIDGITGFNEEDSLSVFNFMKLAVHMAKSGTSVVNAVVIVDPSTGHVIASSCDHVLSCNAIGCDANKIQKDPISIENSAARDRLLFPVFDQEDDEVSCTTGSSLKRQKVHTTVEDDERMENGSRCDSTRPYLCTGNDIYFVWEPCTMCSMAIVHQRFKRVFYAFPNPNDGALGSVHRLQGERSLNHHYAVFRVSLPEDILNSETLPTSCNTDQLTTQLSL
ncbi:probable inactive tRNA-specific adenosine deaminase-like protein 3 [Phtheirospermum japonicum]|uniref:Probable inactive tRNA-specific adenosine deaminase-like protein 3 n=1 Tax=Phtheirospermum japonicum TaxID=374723 RepID=A0A830BGZ9_9LAMI|nr:probable inactive tRNA-specific adenosine deaminase-like protein 3 [Phtheirospermum japonicum]